MPLPTAGDWKLETRLGGRRHVEVWRARHVHRALTAAVKIAKRPAGPHLASAIARMAGLASIDHPSIERIYDLGTVERSGAPHLWSAHEIIAGDSLAARRAQLDWRHTARVLRQVMAALQYAHAVGVVHRDLRPENILFRNSDGWDAVIADFEIGWFQTPPPAPGDAAAFAPPEQAGGSEVAQGTPVDTYAIGALAWWCVTGRPPFGDADARAVVYAHKKSPLPPLQLQFEVPAGFEDWVRALLHKVPRERMPLHAALDALDELDGDVTYWRDLWPHPRSAATAGLVGMALPGLQIRRDAVEQLVGRFGDRVVVALRGPQGSGRNTLALHAARRLTFEGRCRTLTLRDDERPIEALLARWLRADIEDPAVRRERREYLGVTDPIDEVLFREAADDLRAHGRCSNAPALARRLALLVARDTPLLVVARSSRPEALDFVDALVADGHAHLAIRTAGEPRSTDEALDVDPLDAKEQVRLLDGMAPLAPEDKRVLLDASDPWPGDLSRRLRLRLPHLRWEAGHLTTASHRLSLLPPPEDARLGIAIGGLMRRFHVPTWRRALGACGIGDPDSVLRALVARNALTFTEEGFGVSGDIVNEILQSATPAELEAWHRALAHAWVQRPLEAAHHYVHARDPQSAVDVLDIDPFSPLIPDLKLQMATAALDLLSERDPQRGRPLTARAVAAASMSGTEALQESTEALWTWITRTRGAGWVPYGHVLEGWLALARGDDEAAVQHVSAGLDRSPAGSVRAQLLRCLGVSRLRAGEPEEGIRHLQQAVRTPELDPSTRMRVHVDLAWALGAAGRAEDALALLEPLMEKAPSSYRPVLHQTRGDLHRWTGQLDAAEKDYSLALRWAARDGHPTPEHRAYQGLLHWARNELDALDALLPELVDAPEAWVAAPGRALAIRRGVDVPSPIADRALAAMEAHGWPWDPDTERLLGEALDHATGALQKRIRIVLFRPDP